HGVGVCGEDAGDSFANGRELIVAAGAERDWREGKVWNENLQERKLHLEGVLAAVRDAIFFQQGAGFAKRLFQGFIDLHIAQGSSPCPRGEDGSRFATREVAHAENDDFGREGNTSEDFPSDVPRIDISGVRNETCSDRLAR